MPFAYTVPLMQPFRVLVSLGRLHVPNSLVCVAGRILLCQCPAVGKGFMKIAIMLEKRPGDKIAVENGTAIFIDAEEGKTLFYALQQYAAEHRKNRKAKKMLEQFEEELNCF